MLHIQSKDSLNRTKNLHFNIIENAGQGDCLFLSINAFLMKNNTKFKDIPTTTKELRNKIVDEIISPENIIEQKDTLNLISEINVNLKNHIPILSSIDIN